MQTPKASKNSSPTQTSEKSSPSVNRTARQLKAAGQDFDPVSSPSPVNKMPKNRSPRVPASGSPRSAITEKKCPTKLAELQSQLAHLQDELKRSKEQVSLLEKAKKNAQQEAEETKKHLEVMSEKLKDSQEQLHDLSSSEDDRLQELRKLSQERDRAWKSELEAVQNQHSMDSTSLTSARNEIQKLKRYLEENAYPEIKSLRAELSETLSVVNTMKGEISEFKASEARALEAYNKLASDLEKSKDQVSQLREELESRTDVPSSHDDDSKKEENKKLKDEIESLKSALETSEIRYEEEYIQSTLQIRNAYDQVELLKSELKSELESNEELSIKSTENESNAKKSEIEADLQAALFNKETEFQIIKEENTKLETERKEAMLKLGQLTEEADKSSQKAARASGQLEAAQKDNSELETELRRLKVQSEQWRKAAEAAAAILSFPGDNNNNGKITSKTVSFDENTLGGKMGSPLSDDEDLSKKKNGNVLKKIGVLWKKGQK